MLLVHSSATTWEILVFSLSPTTNEEKKMCIYHNRSQQFLSPPMISKRERERAGEKESSRDIQQQTKMSYCRSLSFIVSQVIPYLTPLLSVSQLFLSTLIHPCKRLDT